MPNENCCKIKTKEILMVLVSVFVAVLIFFFAVKSFNEIGQDKNPNQQSTINVTGEGEIFVKPDIAEIFLSVEKEAVSIADVQKQATNAINKIVAFLKESGIEDKDIKTTNYSIYPRYDYLEKTGRVFRGYIISQTLDVKIRKIDNAGKVLAGATEAGANQVGGISFTVDDMDAVQRQAREAAIKDAKEKAKQLAKNLDVKIVSLVSFSESGNGFPMPLYEAKSDLGMGGGSIAAPEIPSGENKVTVNVNLTYEIK